jgi:hypothetical protein
VTLLLDVHHSPRAAERLVERGYDAVAAATDQALSSMADEDLLRHASTDGRAVVTENAKDFGAILRTWASTGEQHAGVIFTSPRRFHRGSAVYPENLVVALARLLDAPPEADKDWVHWLERAASG